MAIIGRDVDGALLVGRFTKLPLDQLRRELDEFGTELTRIQAERKVPYVAGVRLLEDHQITLFMYAAYTAPAIDEHTATSSDELARMQSQLRGDTADISAKPGPDKVGAALERPAGAGTEDDFDAL